MTEPKDVTGRITQAELARRLKVSRASVCKAVKGGRITPDEDGMFDPVEAELQWVSNTRQTAGSKRTKSAGGYAEARGRKEAALARMAELRLAQAEGNLVELDAVLFVLRDLGTGLRDRLENLADRLAPEVFQRPTLTEVHSRISDVCHDVLMDLSEAMERRSKELAAGTPAEV